MEWIFIVVILIFSAVIHEIAHGAMANQMGDPTARYAGRLTLNPIKHLDPVGSIMVPLFLIFMANVFGGGVVFGWAKPVPINPYNFKDQKYGSAKVAAAGPLSNLALALIFGLAIRFIPAVSLNPQLLFVFGIIAYINIILCIFNLLPIPPLDGSHILFTFLPFSMNEIKMFLQQYGFFILLFIIFFFLRPVFALIALIFQFIVGMPFANIFI